MHKAARVFLLAVFIFTISVHAEEKMTLQDQLDEANRVIEEETQKQQELSGKLKELEARIEELRIKAKELDEQIGE